MERNAFVLDHLHGRDVTCKPAIDEKLVLVILLSKKAQTLINVMSSFNSKVPSFPDGENMKNTAALL